MPDTSLEYRKRFLKNQLSFNRKYKGIFDDIANQFAQLSNDPNIKFSKAFKFPPQINKKITAIIQDFHDQTLFLTEQEITNAWDLSNSKNDKIVSDYLKTISAIKTAQKAAYFLPNIPALKAFISTKHGTETLSDSVWQVAEQLRGELKIHLGIGLMNGDSANVISQRIRQYLKNPDALFRRVRDNQGRLVASKAMLENAPGTGTYNSAYKNAMRVARSNTNQAYLLADNIRWRGLDMVIGFEISLSAQHPDYPYVEICEEMVGIYPKTFIWVGWHPHDLCHCVPVMMPNADFKAYLKGDQPLKAEQITEFPEGFKQHVKDNFERYSNYKSTPFWIEDNAEIIKDILKSK